MTNDEEKHNFTSHSSTTNTKSFLDECILNENMKDVYKKKKELNIIVQKASG